MFRLSSLRRLVSVSHFFRRTLYRNFRCNQASSTYTNGCACTYRMERYRAGRLLQVWEIIASFVCCILCGQGQFSVVHLVSSFLAVESDHPSSSSRLGMNALLFMNLFQDLTGIRLSWVCMRICECLHLYSVLQKWYAEMMARCVGQFEYAKLMHICWSFSSGEPSSKRGD